MALTKSFKEPVQARNLFGVIGYLQKQAGVELHVTPEPT